VTLAVSGEPTWAVPLMEADARVGAAFAAEIGPKAFDLTVVGVEMPLSAVAFTRTNLSTTELSGVQLGVVVVATTVTDANVMSAATSQS
jgi:hypothetical protein